MLHECCKEERELALEEIEKLHRCHESGRKIAIIVNKKNIFEF